MYFWVLVVYLCYSDRHFYADYAEAYVGEPVEDTVDYFEQQYAEETSVGNRLVDNFGENEYDGSLSLPLLRRRERAVGGVDETATPKKEEVPSTTTKQEPPPDAAATTGTSAAAAATKETSAATTTKQTSAAAATKETSSSATTPAKELSTKEILSKEILKMPETQCAQHGIFCRCGFQSVKFAYKYLGNQRDCYSLKGVCQYCGKNDRVTELGFDYTYDDVGGHDVYRMRVLKENELWIPPEYTYKCMKGHVVTGVMSKYVRFPSLGDRDFYILKIKCTKLKGKTDPNLRPETWKGEGECGTPGKFSGPEAYFLKERGVAVRNVEDGWGSSVFLLDQIGDDTSRIGIQFTCSRNSQVAGLKYKFGSPTDNYDTIDFGLACRPNGKMEVWELGKSQFVDIEEYTPADTNEILIVDGYVQYRVADRTIYSSKVKYQGKSHFQVSMHDEGSTVRDISYICRTDKFDKKERRLLQKDSEESDDEYELHLERLPELLGLPEGDVMFVDFPDEKKTTEVKVGTVSANSLNPTLQNVLKQFEGFVGKSVSSQNQQPQQQTPAAREPEDDMEEDTAEANEDMDLQEGLDSDNLRQSDQEELEGLAAINDALDAQLNAGSLTDEVEVGELEPAIQDLLNDLFPEEEDDVGVPFYDAYDEHEVGDNENTPEEDYLDHVFDEIFTEVEVGENEDTNEEEENLGVPFYDADDEDEVGDIAFIDPYVEKEVGTLEDELDQKVFGTHDSVPEQTESLKPLPVGDDFFKLDDSQIIQKFLAEEKGKTVGLTNKDLLEDILSDKQEKKTSETHEANPEQHGQQPEKEARWHTLEDTQGGSNLFSAEAEVGSINIKRKADEALKESTHYMHKLHYVTASISAVVHVWAKLLGLHGLTFTADYATSPNHKVWWAHLMKKGHHVWVSASIVWKLILLGSVILSMLTVGVVCFHCRKRGDKIDVDYLLPSGDEQEDDLIIDHHEQAMLHY